MKFIHILSEILNKPWLITPQGHLAVRTLVENRLDNLDNKKLQENIDLLGQPLPFPEVKPNGVMVIPIQGVMGRKLGVIEKSCGAVDTNDVMDWVTMAAEMPEVKAVVLDISSPGGTVSGVPELANMISALNTTKTVVAHISDVGCSAAYWVASSAQLITADASAETGSIGVYMALVDQSAAFAMNGLKTEVIASGKFKGMGLPGTSLTEEQRALLEAQVMEIYEGFKNQVISNRPQVAEEAMQGQTFLAPSALKAGLIDEICSLHSAINTAAVG